MDPEIVDAPDAIEMSPATARGRVRFRDVSFHYPTPPVPSRRAHEAVAEGEAATDEVPPAHLLEPEWAPEVELGLDAREADQEEGLAAAVGPDDEVEPAAAARLPFVLEHLDFVAEPGELVALVGPSGSGKTTTTYLV